jgi:TolB-like protein
MQALKVVLGVSAALLLVACETTPKPRVESEPTYEQAQNHPLRAANYSALDELMKPVRGGAASASNRPGDVGSAPYIVSTLANIDALVQSSTLGRVISEQIASRLAQTGHQVVELKVRNGIYMKRNEGEFLLTREIKEVAAAHKAQGVIVGTYAESAGFVHVTLKLVDPASSLVLSAYDYTLPLDRQVRSMLRSK